MNRRITGVVGVAAALGLAATALPGNAHAVTGIDGSPHAKGTAKPAKQDDLPDPLHEKRAAVRQNAVDQLARGEARLKGSGAHRSIQMADGTLVSYPVTQTAQLLTFLVEFGDDNTNSAFAGQQGPVHNRIPEPGVSDNSTYWEKDFSPEHYKEMFFSGLQDQDDESFAGAYDEMSSGRFKLQGDVSDWVKLDKSEASYQADASDPDVPAGDETQAGMTSYIQDTANAWYQSQLDSGKTPEEVEAYLKSFDVWDRYDIDGDGITNEPDGYIDHFQAIHAGTGEEDGSAPWAIWSHRWAVNQAGEGKDGPATSTGCSACAPLGGIKIGNSDLWIRDYTTEPENGGLGVFAHEFGHDLGLPDFYDTQSNDPENGTAFWTLMSSGSWMNHGTDSIGTTPNHMGPSEKLFLGWYGPDNQDLAVVDNSDVSQVVLGPSYHATTTGKQAALVLLPPGEATIETGPAASGTHFLYSGSADDQRATAASKPFTVPAGADLTAKVRYDLEKGYDFTYLEVTDDGGATWTPIQTNLSNTTPSLRFGIDGTSDSTCKTNCKTKVPNGWKTLTADLAAYEGKEVQVRFRTATDGGMHFYGFAFDDVAVGNALVDGFENGTADWKLTDYFAVAGHSYLQPYDQSYMVENRQYQGYDKTLKEGPYNFGFARTAPDRVEHFPYQDGLLVWYRNGFYTDNNTSAHPGYGQSLPVDANARPLRWPDGTVARNRIQSFDATFDVDRTDAIRLQRQLASGTQVLSAPSVQSPSTFDDSDVDAYWDAANPAGSSKVAGTGTVVKVLSSDEATGRMVIEVGTKAVARTKPTISGAARVGSTLTAAAGTWEPSGADTSSFQWNVNGRAVPGATASRYVVRPADAGKTITVTQTVTVAGHYPGSATSAPTAKVQSARTTISASAPRSVKRGKKATVRVAVTSPGLTPGGTVTVSLGGKRVTTALSGGHATVKVRATAKKGKRKLVVAYRPSTGFTGATKTLTIRVR